MTLCIAAMATKQKKFVAACDFKIGNDAMSAEPPMSKVNFLGKKIKWVFLYAGDPTHAWSITARVKAKLQNQTETFAAVSEAFKTSFKEELEQKIDDEILGTYGMNRKEFVLGGKTAFGEEMFGKILYEVAQKGLETEFLVGNPARIFSVVDPGIVQYHDSLGFHAIGTGAFLARASLIGDLKTADYTENVIYKVLEAKFRGESAAGVGNKTFVVVMDSKGEINAIFPKECGALREIWEAEGRPKIPPEAVRLIKDSVKPMKILPLSESGDRKSLE